MDSPWKDSSGGLPQVLKGFLHFSSGKKFFSSPFATQTNSTNSYAELKKWQLLWGCNLRISPLISKLCSREIRRGGLGKSALQRLLLVCAQVSARRAREDYHPYEWTRQARPSRINRSRVVRGSFIWPTRGGGGGGVWRRSFGSFCLLE